MATEEQTVYSQVFCLSSYHGNLRAGQEFDSIISNRTISKLSFPVHKYGSPTGNVTFTIRAVSDDSIINSKVWGDASALSTEVTWEEAEFDTPITINEEVRIQVEYTGGGQNDYVGYNYRQYEVKEDEHLIRYTGSYVHETGEDGAYIYTYTAANGNVTVTPTTLSLTLTEYVPVLKEVTTPGVLTLTTTGHVPVLKETLTPSTLSLTLTGYTPVLKETLTPQVLALTLTSYAPVLKEVITPATLALILTGYAPSAQLTHPRHIVTLVAEHKYEITFEAKHKYKAKMEAK